MLQVALAAAWLSGNFPLVVGLFFLQLIFVLGQAKFNEVKEDEVLYYLGIIVVVYFVLLLAQCAFLYYLPDMLHIFKGYLV